jgi:hypothetical protein
VALICSEAFNEFHTRSTKANKMLKTMKHRADDGKSKPVVLSPLLGLTLRRFIMTCTFACRLIGFFFAIWKRVTNV